MKLFKNITFGLVAAAALALASCSNDQPEFNDKDAFVSFTGSSASIDENKGTLQIPVLLSSLHGMDGQVDFDITPAATAGAVEGTNFTVANSSRTLTFTKDANVQNIEINVIDLAGKFTGDLAFTVTLKNPQGVNLGAENTFTVTITDLDHPLAFMLGSFTAKGESQFDGDTEWTIQIEKDASDVNKVWIKNLVPDGSSPNSPVYGTVNDEKTELRIPVEQYLAKSSTQYAWLYAFGGIEGGSLVDEITDYIKATITTDADGNAVISIPCVFGAYVTSDAEGKSGLGWANLMKGAEMHKAK